MAAGRRPLVIHDTRPGGGRILSTSKANSARKAQKLSAAYFAAMSADEARRIIDGR